MQDKIIGEPTVTISEHGNGRSLLPATANAEAFEMPRGTGRVEVPEHIWRGKERDSDAYALRLTGDCLEPEVYEGDWAIASPSRRPRAGEFVVLWPKEGTPLLKRLVAEPMAFPQNLHPDSEVMPLIEVEMLNPRRHFMIPANKLSAVHAVIGTFPDAALPPRKKLEIEDLPFVRRREKSAPGERLRCWWHVETTGDYGEDCRLGGRYAAQFLDYLVSTDVADGGLLRWIAEDQQSGIDNGISVGFWSYIARAAVLGRAQAVGEDRARNRAYADCWREYEAEEAQRRSERARHAARARWAKRRAGGGAS